MSADDDLDCVEHVWGLTEAILTSRGAEKVKSCDRCEAIAYEPGQAAELDRRPPL